MKKVLSFASLALSLLLVPSLKAQSVNNVKTEVIDIHPTLNVHVNVHAQVSSNGVPAASTYAVNITWTLPTGQCAASDTINPCGFNIYRSAHGANAYSLVGSTSATSAPNATSFLDNTVAANTEYDYQVETTWLPSGQTVTLNSGPSNTASVTVPNVPTAPVVSATVTAGM